MVNLQTLEGSGILYRYWPAAQSRAVFLLIYGLGAHTERWNFLAEYFAPRGFSSYAIELRGFGETKDRPRGHIDSFATYYNDLSTLVELIKKEQPGKKIILIGESMGGLITFNLAAKKPELFAGVICMSPCFKSKIKFPVLDTITFVPSLIMNPKKIINVPFDSKMCTDDQDYLAKMNADPRELRTASANLLFQIILEQFKAKRSLAEIKIPILFVASGKDYLSDLVETRKIFAKIKFKDKLLREYPAMLHCLHLDLGREKVFQDILEWATRRI